jgi:hypothetical protein
MLMRFIATEEDLVFQDEQVKTFVKANDGCRRLLALEGVGPIGALLLQARSTDVEITKEFSSKP